jgi:hypothetical protein
MIMMIWKKTKEGISNIYLRIGFLPIGYLFYIRLSIMHDKIEVAPCNLEHR